MSLIVEQGEEVILQTIKNNTTWYAQLYTNSGSPSNTDVLGDYTLASFDGGSSIPLDSWSNISDNSNRGQMSHPAINWTASDNTGLPQTCYGYLVYDSSGNLIWVSPFDQPQTFTNTGDSVTVNIVLQMFDWSLA